MQFYRAHLLHNPSAGEEDHSEEELVKSINRHGFKCSYSAINNWNHIPKDTDFLIIAGGDGTIRQIAKEMLSTIHRSKPIAILPKGTANNIAESLDSNRSHEELISSWKYGTIKKMTLGSIKQNDHETFFIESCGFGAFPMMMKEMENIHNTSNVSQEEKLKTARQKLQAIIKTMESFHCTIVADGIKYEDDYVLAEVMNVPFMGPKLCLSPESNPFDKTFELATVKANEIAQFEEFLAMLNIDEKPALDFCTLKAGKFDLHCKCNAIHIDDEYSENEGSGFVIKPGAHSLYFIT